MNLNVSAREQMQLVGGIHSQLLDNGSASSAGIKVVAQRYYAVFDLGATDTTTDNQLMSCDNVAGDNAAAITGLVGTQLTDANDNKWQVFELTQDDMPATQDYFLARSTAGDGATGSQVACQIFAVGLPVEKAGKLETSDVIEYVAN